MLGLSSNALETRWNGMKWRYTSVFASKSMSAIMS